jgi:hypothetical protein
MTTVEANGVTLGVEHFGEATAPLILLVGGPTMLSWHDSPSLIAARPPRGTHERSTATSRPSR